MHIQPSSKGKITIITPMVHMHESLRFSAYVCGGSIRWQSHLFILSLQESMEEHVQTHMVHTFEIQAREIFRSSSLDMLYRRNSRPSSHNWKFTVHYMDRNFAFVLVVGHVLETANSIHIFELAAIGTQHAQKNDLAQMPMVSPNSRTNKSKLSCTTGAPASTKIVQGRCIFVAVEFECPIRGISHIKLVFLPSRCIHIHMEVGRCTNTWETVGWRTSTIPRGPKTRKTVCIQWDHVKIETMSSWCCLLRICTAPFANT